MAVSIAVMQYTPVSMALRLIRKPSLLLSPCPSVGVSITRSILCPRIRSITLGDSWDILLTQRASMPCDWRYLAVERVAYIL